MAATGHRDTRQNVIYDGWDSAELQKYQLQDGATFAQAVQRIEAAVSAFNSELYNHPLWSSMVSYTDEPDLTYRTGTAAAFEDFTEYGTPKAQRGEETGHMLPLKAKDLKLGWTWDYLRKARTDHLMNDVRTAIDAARDAYRTGILTRALQRGDDSGSAKGLGSSGYSPGFATAAASTSVDYTPPTYSGKAFTSDHEHYVGIAGGAFTAAVFTDAHNELREHGHNPPYDFIIGESDQATVEGLTGFVKATASWVEYSALTDLAAFSNQSVEAGVYPIGAFKDFRVWVVYGMPQYYGFGWKSYGRNSPRNPFAIRLFKGIMRPMVQVMPDPRSGAGGAYPLQDAVLFTEFGVGVADRTNGTARYVNNTTWADGTPT